MFEEAGSSMTCANAFVARSVAATIDTHVMAVSIPTNAWPIVFITLTIMLLFLLV